MLRSLIKSCKQVAEGLTSGVQLAPKPIVLYAFDSQKVVDKWHVFTDAFFGGKSQATLQYNAEEQAAEFSGRCTLDQEADADIKRAGYCVASSKVEYIADYFDLSGFSHLVYSVKGDGRTYIANVRVDSMAGTGGDVWQAPFRPSAGLWSTVHIPIDSLALTYQGQLVENKLDFQADKVISVGVSVSATSSASNGSRSPSTHISEQAENIDAADIGDSSSRGQPTGAATAAAAGNTDQQQGSSLDSRPHEMFRLFIRDIRAEGEM